MAIPFAQTVNATVKVLDDEIATIELAPPLIVAVPSHAAAYAV